MFIALLRFCWTATHPNACSFICGAGLPANTGRARAIPLWVNGSEFEARQPVALGAFTARGFFSGRLPGFSCQRSALASKRSCISGG